MVRRIASLAGLLWIVLCLVPVPSYAACTGDTTTWTCTAGTTIAQVNTMIAAAADGSTATFDAGSYSWSGRAPFSSGRGLTLICATTPPASAPWGAATSGGCDVTVGGGILGMDQWPGGTNTKLYRISGFNFIAADDTTIWFGYSCGPCSTSQTFTNIRIDHNSFLSASADSTMIFFGENTSPAYFYGLVDHNHATSAGSIALSEIIGGGNELAPAGTRGTVNNMFIEDNTLTVTTMTNSGLGCVDSWYGQSIVFRSNSMTNCLWTSHGITHARGPVNYEVYRNTFVATSGMGGGFESGYRMLHHQGSGEFLAFDNIITPLSGNSGTPISMTYYRSADPIEAVYSGERCDGSSGLDGNRVGLSGYPCLRQPGRDVNAVLQPMYVWNNYFSDTSARAPMVVENPWSGPPFPTTHIVANRDYYNSVSKDAQTSSSAPFDGTTGMGFGTLARRPATCTTGAEAPDAGNGGVGYWATDSGEWDSTNGATADGLLYRCSATNTWTLHYTPYTYPHPLQGVVSGTRRFSPRQYFRKIALDEAVLPVRVPDYLHLIDW